MAGRYRTTTQDLIAERRRGMGHDLPSDARSEGDARVQQDVMPPMGERPGGKDGASIT